jgi:hypothetical protein
MNIRADAQEHGSHASRVRMKALLLRIFCGLLLFGMFTALQLFVLRPPGHYPGTALGFPLTFFAIGWAWRGHPFISSLNFVIDVLAFQAIAFLLFFLTRSRPYKR